MRLVEQLFETAKDDPMRPLLRMPGSTHTYRDAELEIRRVAGGLRGLGIRAGSPVGVLLHNRPQHVITTFALSQVGAVTVPINPDLVGEFLSHPLAVSKCQLVIVESTLLPRLRDVLDQLSAVETVVVLSDHGDPVEQVGSSCQVVPFSDVATAEPSMDVTTMGDLQPAMILFTSGTTGRSKGCVLSHRYLIRQAQNHVKYLGLRANDVLYSPFPLFHIDAAVLTVGAAVAVGCTAAVGTRFSVSRFWDEVREFDATVLNFMGAMLTLLWKLPETPDDRRHRLRLGWGVPMPRWDNEWRARHGFGLYEVYGLTDGGVVCYDPKQGRRRGACGRVIPEFDVAIADSDGELLPPGESGEILIRPKEAGTVMTEYVGMPAATAEAFRGLWLHTGDLGRLDVDGFLYFGGRIKDSIRRRGENISLSEVEAVIASHPDVVEAAAVGVPSELAEEELKVCVVVREGAKSTPPDLAEYFANRAPRFMVPRYVELLPELPKTPTEKVEKFRLRDAGVTRGTWDRESVRAGRTR